MTGRSDASAVAADQEAAFWYGREEPAPAAPEPVRGPFEPVRGPFEPLHHADGAAAQPSPAGQSPVAPADALAGGGQPDAASPAGPDEQVSQHARKLEQIKDLYVTAEAIGEANVAKHFDQLLAQQRELIGDYIKQSKAALHKDEPAADPTAP